MTIVKSISVGNGDLFYIKHGSDNFTIIDCNIADNRKDAILSELRDAAQGKTIQRFISTHPDEDHIHGLEHIDKNNLGWNFYCVKNNVWKEDETASFKRYKKLRDDMQRAFYIHRGCSRRWMNESDETRGSAGINILWPDTSNDAFLKHLAIAEQGGNSNNICPIIKYSLENGAVVIWMGDLESNVMEEIVDEVDLPKTDILFAPHHGRKSGHVPKKWLDIMEPKIVVVGEAPSKDLNYYSDYNTITQNSAGDIEFDCGTGKVHVRVSSSNYEAGFLQDMGVSSRRKSDGDYVWYIGSFKTHKQS
ncbi:hypothetical protein [Olsenella uli]